MRQQTDIAMDPVRRAWLRELGVDRLWSGGPPPGAMVATTSPEVQAQGAEATVTPVLGKEAAAVEERAAQLPTVAEAVIVQAPALAPKPALNDADAWQQLQAEVSGCTACGLCKGRTQTVFGTGVRPARWMVIGEAPGEQEDLQGKPFVGRSGRLLDSMLAAVGRGRQQDVFIANVIKCRPPGNRDPLPEEVAACSPYLMRQVELVNPELILVVGRFAAQALLGSDARIGSLRGQRHEVQVGERRVPVVVSYHPAYLLRSPQEKSKAWQDLSLALDVGATQGRS